jgi:hypothetical protein
MSTRAIRGSALGAFVATLAILALPSTASAAVSCDLTGGTLTVNVTGTGDQTAGLKMVNGGTEVGVFSDLGTSVPQLCNVNPVPAATTDSIQVTDTDPGSQRTLVKVSLAGGPFLNSIATGEGTGHREIEIVIDGANEATDDFVLDGGPAATDDNWRMGDLSAGPGDEGINLDDGETGTIDVDDVRLLNMDQLQFGLNGNDGDDIIDARGGPGFTGPMTMTSSVKQLVTGLGDDQIYAGDGNNWRLEGQQGADTMIGGPGNDTMWASFGDDPDVIQANGGSDACTWQNHNDPVRVDLNVTTPQDTLGAGVDTISGCEDLNGGNGGDVLVGNAGPNQIFGNPGDDTILPGPGGAADTVDGGAGTGDTIDYSDAGSAVTVSLAIVAPTAQNTGQGSDTISNAENLTGSAFGDTLTGDAQINRVEGGDGVDDIDLGDNDDVFDSYDAVADDVDCGNGNDSGFASEVAVDTLTDCETPDFAPGTTVATGPGDGALTADNTPTYGLTGSDEGAVTFEVRVDNGTYAACGVSCQVPALSDGTHTLRFRAVEVTGAGHPDPTPVQRTITVDTQAPVVTIDSGPSGATTDSSPTFAFSSPDSTADFACSVDGGAFGPCSGAGSHTTASLSDGSHTFAVRASDAVGNESVATRGFSVDATAPDTMFRKPKVKKDAVKIKFSSTEVGSSFTCKLDRKKAKPCTSPVRYRNLKRGKHKVIVTATDAAGNPDATPARVKFRVEE